MSIPGDIAKIATEATTVLRALGNRVSPKVAEEVNVLLKQANEGTITDAAGLAAKLEATGITAAQYAKEAATLRALIVSTKPAEVGGAMGRAAQVLAKAKAAIQPGVFRDAAERLGQQMHNVWRETRQLLSGDAKAADGLPLRESRWKMAGVEASDLGKVPDRFKKPFKDLPQAAKDELSKGGKKHVPDDAMAIDIANLDIGRLTPAWAYENAEAGKVAVGTIEAAAKAQAGQGRIVVVVEDAAKVVHNRWLSRQTGLAPEGQTKIFGQLSAAENSPEQFAKLLNDAGCWAPAGQAKPYALLVPEEKAKDIAHVKDAAELVNGGLEAAGQTARVVLQ